MERRFLLATDAQINVMVSYFNEYRCYATDRNRTQIFICGMWNWWKVEWNVDGFSYATLRLCEKWNAATSLGLA
jgi:hypothetical protein